jgi:DNA modification methylase
MRYWYARLQANKIIYGSYSPKKTAKPSRTAEHPTMKPIPYLLSGLNKRIAAKRDIVIDLFLGSGSTMVAAHQLK